MNNNKESTNWPQTEGQLVLAELLKQAGPTQDEKRTHSVIDGWVRFVEGNAEKILWLRGRRFEDQAELFMDGGVELDSLMKSTVDAHLSRSEIYRVIEETLMTGGVDEDQARVARECLMKYVAPIREVIVTRPRKK